MKYLRYFKPDDLFARVKASRQNFLSLGFFRNRIGITVVDTSLGRSFGVRMLESSEGNFSLSPLEAELKHNMVEETTLKVLSLRDSLSKLMATGGSTSLKQMMVSDMVQFGELSQELGSLVKDFTGNELILRQFTQKRDCSILPGEFRDGKFVLHHLTPLQVLKPEMSVEGIRNAINKLTAIYNIGGILFSVNLRCFDDMKKVKYLENELKRLDKDGQLLQRRCTLVDDVGALKKVEKDIKDLYPELSGVEPLLQKYPHVGRGYTDTKLLGRDLTKYRDCVRACYASGFLSENFYTEARKTKLARNKLHKRDQEKLLKFAEMVGLDTNS